MSEADFYFTISAPGKAELKDKGSKFFAYSFPVQSALTTKQIIDSLKKEHPKATHHCYAYRIGLDGNTYRTNDDGEPSGTAGRPILGQIDSKQLTDVLIIVVRYFGGTLLGIPGLTNAYKISASLVLQTSTIIKKPVEISYVLQFDYTILNNVMQILKQFNVTIKEKQLNLFCRIIAGFPRSTSETVLYHLNELRFVDIEKL